MKILMIYDQIQAGAGIKDDRMVPLGLNKGATGPAVMMAPYLKRIDGHVQACLYCGDGYYEANPDEVNRKLCAMVDKLQADIVICGPCFDYQGYAQMAAQVAKAVNEKTKAKALAAMAQECGQVIGAYKDRLPIVRMPKKGAAGLNQSLETICDLAYALYHREDEAALIGEYCY
ncbi:hypothetical protein STRDD11_00865 [Streptococcus sp. DD11]|uniref:GrdB-related putative oxidoreductase n=1 Tax=Streptococcus sp. DD11 TaxID=1777879 RepID=UPI000796057E|nr:GrdB-related putative oxidoreductase [Streptococcus sp. DD11]KXT84627.1 hypothetical protein STRDD11_00865 [Streptococcus sp. DD11]